MGVGHIYFDREHNVLYSAGRGEMKIGIYNYDGTTINFLSSYVN